MGNVDHDLHSMPGMGLRSTEFQRINQQRIERKPRVSTWAQQVSENRGLFLKWLPLPLWGQGRKEGGWEGTGTWEAPGGPHALLWGLSQALTCSPWRQSSRSSDCCVEIRRCASGIKSLHNQLTDNTLTPSTGYLFTYYSNTLLNIFINWENWSFKLQRTAAWRAILFKIIQLFHFCAVEGTCSLKQTCIIDKQTGKKDKTKDLHGFLYFQNYLYEYLAGREFIYKNGILLHIIFHLPLIFTKFNKLPDFFSHLFLLVGG